MHVCMYMSTRIQYTYSTVLIFKYSTPFLQILMNVTPIMEDAVRFVPIMMDHLSVHVTLAMS